MINLPLFNIIYADPPWQYNDKLSNGERGVDFKYKTLNIKDIMTLPIQNIAAEDCTLFMWGTWPLLKECIATVEAWGFEYKTCAFVWNKVTKTEPLRLIKGMGRYTRGNTEYVLIGRKGKMLERHDKAVSQVLFSDVTDIVLAPRGEKHSQKPDSVIGRITQMYPTIPKIELFARRRLKGWNATGLEYDNTDIRDFLKRYEK
jgi:site-specific DNA-methyltransferase (adenine-specific)